jgi:enoyl-CoA hydratase
MSVMKAEEGRRFGELGAAVFRKIELMAKPVIAAVNGFALGGGCELAMACDIRIASDNAKFGQPETGLGILPGFGGTQRLARLVGKGRAKELIFTCDMIDANEAYRIGLANKVVPQAELLDTCKAMAEKIMSKGSYAISLAKEAINTGTETDLSSGLTLEADLFGLAFSTDDKKEGMTAFLEKRKANLTDF